MNKGRHCHSDADPEFTRGKRKNPRTLDSISTAERHSRRALSTKRCSRLHSENALQQYRSIKRRGFLATLRKDSFYF